MIKLIASDMDGTVLRNGAQELPEGFTDLILRLKDCGVHFVAASGRQYQNLRRLFGPIQNEFLHCRKRFSLYSRRKNFLSRRNRSFSRT